MQHVDIKEIYEAFTEDDVNLHLDIGWVIVAVTSGERYSPAGTKEIGPIYVMGLPRSVAEADDEPPIPVRR
ncbi:hypothetical protein PSYMO_22378 [Pseudomonas amygdali pv. mori str. 301020]|uniref:Uncharacterized protein n=1 Tax=Pseudomonas amygdali pv. mori str. 301020 TaxID=629261 RepID=A0A656GE84_PSEA0|nr:hypothetical protein PSYMO_22378 [Pseudomonas amygdali pv. mori str. 301020]